MSKMATYTYHFAIDLLVWQPCTHHMEDTDRLTCHLVYAVHTDHKPLETIFKKPLNKAPARLQRMMMCLQRYQFNVSYRKGTSLYIADTLSRAALPSLSTNESATQFKVFRVEVSDQYPQPPSTPSCRNRRENASRNTGRHPVLSHLCNKIINGWPSDR